jgi:malate synthase
MSSYVKRSGLKVDSGLADFVETQALSGLGIEKDKFWSGFANLIKKAMPRNVELLAKREELQTKIDDWHKKNGAIANDAKGYEEFLQKIGYFDEEPADFTISTSGLDEEISIICGPQLVVPVSNARFAINAANARWGSLFDAFYGTDVISRAGDIAPTKGYNPKRGDVVFAKTAQFLDKNFPLENGSHANALGYFVENNELLIGLENGAVKLEDEGQFIGFKTKDISQKLLLKHNGLHVELVIDKSTPIGSSHKAGLSDVLIESALTTIQDCEDSVAAVDAADKIGVYRNWLGLMNGTLEESFEKNSKIINRTLNKDKTYQGINGHELTLNGRALLLVRNVGHLMSTDAIIDENAKPVGEGLMDAVITTLCAMHGLKEKLNSKTNAIYIVKPKMHGAKEVQFACDNFSLVEGFLGLPKNTIKIGIMDEERRTSANLKACIYAARERLFFINTGFLDRTGDEIHTSMQAGPVLPKDEIKSEKWIKAYEDRNVLIGLACGLSGKAQIGKGMWAIPDNMADMLATKAMHPNMGANCAWVPSPTAATLHALHYHEVDVFKAQKRRHNEKTPSLGELFSMPMLDVKTLSKDEIERELENNTQGILGYVVRWVADGVGCSKVPDINNVGLMEDRATCRISSQAIANWLEHDVVSEKQVRETFERMAKVVDEQNAGDITYQNMAGNFENSIPFQAALALAIEGANQPSGYTEPILHAMRKKEKATLT